jgi:major intracellular serine protease
VQGFGSDTAVGSTKEDLGSSFSRGKEIFYETIRGHSSNLPVEENELHFFKKPAKKLRGFYEHLMGFYYYVGLFNAETRSNYLAQIPALSRQMAHEFLLSIREAPGTETLSRLQGVLSSTGFNSRKTAPNFRRFLRSLARPLKAQWAMEESHVRQAQHYSKGERTRLAIIDSGVDPSLKEIKAQIKGWKNFLDGTLPERAKGRFPYDWDGHGTAIASVVIQVAPEVEVMIIKVVDLETMSGVPLTRWNIYLVVAGIYWAVQNGADVISLSLALSGDFEVLRDVSQFCWDNNVIIVTSLGNVEGGVKLSSNYYPAAYETTIAVGGVEKIKDELQVWSHSGRGEYIDIVAPASGIWVELPSYLPKKQWPKKAAGNSFAVPVVASSVALVLSSMEDDIRQRLANTPGLLVETIRNILRQSSSNEKLGLETPNPASGFGLLDIQRAVDSAKDLKSKIPDL